MRLSALQMARMSELLDEALPLDEAGRRRWLQGLPAEQQDLEPALRHALLHTDGEASGALPELEIGQEILAVNILKPGDRVGPYALVRELGSGGMADVWLAQRADGAFKREVALKLPVLARLRKDLAPRFERERDILASLEHPNIARLYDAGVSYDGLPYLAMEFVAGQPLTEWCDAHHLGIRERLKLFLQVLDAVQYAHSQHVIHRDLKPSNILVTDSGQVRLLDFGIAKLLGEEELAQPTQLTRMYGQPLTPDYASPELVRGEPIDAAADVYSLGVVLYGLLCGSRPYQLKPGASVTQLEQAIALARVQKPSTQLGPEAGGDRCTTQHKLARRLKGDLDAIVLKALAKAPAGRYGNAEALADDLQKYLSGEPVEARPDRLSYRFTKFVLRRRTAVMVTALVVVLVGALAYEVIRRDAPTGPPSPSAGSIPRRDLAASGPGPPAFSPPAHSIAVLPFENLSGDTSQEYFSDGLSEELLNDLARINELQVAARTSAFSFKGKDSDIATIAHRLNVASVLEGSVRRSGHTIRVTAQLIDSVTGFHLWAQSYDRDLGDVLRLQTEIANAVANALKVTLLGDVAVKVKLGGTRNPAAFDAYLRGAKAASSGHEIKAIAEYTDAIRLDPNYALAFASRSYSYSHYARGAATGTAIREYLDKGLADALRAIALAPELGEGHLAMGFYLQWAALDFKQASESYERARALAPGSAWVLRTYGLFAVEVGHFDAGLADLRRAVTLDPLNPQDRTHLGIGLYFARRYEEAIAALEEATSLDPDWWFADGFRGLAYYALGNLPRARSSCEAKVEYWVFQRCLGLVYNKLGRHSDAEAAVAKLTGAYDYAVIYTQWGDNPKAIGWLDKAMRLRDTGLVFLKTDPLLDPLRKESRFQAIERALKFPN